MKLKITWWSIVVTLHTDPIQLFQEWFAEALKLDHKDPNFMTLSTVNKEGRPSSRIVLLKHVDDRGFTFFTNLTSRKGHDLIDNPFAALCFYWIELGRQVRVEGKVERVSDKEADDYFSTRSRMSQLGAWASHQSAPIHKPDDLLNRLEIFKQQFGDGPIPRPPFWSGFRLQPDKIEFWTEGEFRLHTRQQYTRQDNNWSSAKLYP